MANTKGKTTYTIDAGILARFNKIADANALNKSKWVEKQMQDYINQFEKEGEK